MGFQPGNTARGKSALLFVARIVTAGVAWGVLLGTSCATDTDPTLPSRRSSNADQPEARLVARFVHVTDTHVLDPESPGRYPGAQAVIGSAWRSWESCSTQLLDGTIRAANRIHASGQNVDFLLQTGDLCDNAQSNELAWAMTLFDGGQVTPLTGPDDRALENLPPPAMDPYAPFTAQGLYRQGVHGSRPSIPWYATVGNHDSLGIGVFPIVQQLDGLRVAPLPLSIRPGLLIPIILDPVGEFAYGPVSPAFPGPPPVLASPSRITANPDRHYFDHREFIAAMFQSTTAPLGHGFVSPDGPPWYSVTPVPGLRLITLDTSDIPVAVPGLPYSEGCISTEQRDFLVAELDAAQARGEWVIVASHHPSVSLELLYRSVLGPEELQALLNQYPNVVAHIAGHKHRNHVADRGGYIEIETCSTLDRPQEGRVIELWQEADGSVAVNYRMFSSLDDDLPPLGEDPLRGLRAQAHDLAEQGKGGISLLREQQPEDPNAEGDPIDRAGTWRRGLPAMAK